MVAFQFLKLLNKQKNFLKQTLITFLSVEVEDGGPLCQVCYYLHKGQKIISHMLSFINQLLELLILFLSWIF